MTLFAVVGVMVFFGMGMTPSKGGGGGIPSPFAASANHKVELADGELYLLEGAVSFDDVGQAVFWVDLKKESWLASKGRMQNPYYKLTGSREQWVQYQGKPIVLACVAKGVVVGDSYFIELVPADSNLERSITEPPYESNRRSGEYSAE